MSSLPAAHQTEKPREGINRLAKLANDPIVQSAGAARMYRAGLRLRPPADTHGGGRSHSRHSLPGLAEAGD
jgi:hypothetical protein